VKNFPVALDAVEQIDKRESDFDIKIFELYINY